MQIPNSVVEWSNAGFVFEDSEFNADRIPWLLLVVNFLRPSRRIPGQSKWRPLPLPSTTFPVHRALINTSFEAVRLTFRANKSFFKQVTDKNKRKTECQRYSISESAERPVIHTAVLLTFHIYNLQQACTIWAPRAAGGTRNIFSGQGRSAQLPFGPPKIIFQN